MNVLIEGEVFGAVKYWLYSVQWQKRGLPHAHILIWFINTIKAKQIDDIISAEIQQNMVHGPCGSLNW